MAVESCRGGSWIGFEGRLQGPRVEMEKEANRIGVVGAHALSFSLIDCGNFGKLGCLTIYKLLNRLNFLIDCQHKMSGALFITEKHNKFSSLLLSIITLTFTLPKRGAFPPATFTYPVGLSGIGIFNAFAVVVDRMLMSAPESSKNLTNWFLPGRKIFRIGRTSLLVSMLKMGKISSRTSVGCSSSSSTAAAEGFRSLNPSKMSLLEMDDLAERRACSSSSAISVVCRPLDVDLLVGRGVVGSGRLVCDQKKGTSLSHKTAMS